MKKTIKITALFLGLAPLCALFLAFNPLVVLVQSTMQESKAQELNEYVEARSDHINNVIMQQLLKFNYDCSEADIQTLHNPLFYNHYVRFVGMYTADGKSCSTLGDFIGIKELQHDESTHFPIGFRVGLTSNEHAEFFIQYSLNGHHIYWVLDNSWVSEKINARCKDCYFVKFNYNDKELSQLSVIRGNENIPLEDDFLEYKLKNSDLNIDIDVFTGAQARDFAAHLLLIVGIPVSALLGLIFVLIYFVFQGQKESITELIQRGITHDQFIPYYQAIINITTGKVVGYEALLRWKKHHEIVPPGMFIGAAEESDLIVPITEKVIRKIINDLQKLPKEVWVSINIVPSHLETSSLSELLAELNWPSPQRIKFEITERMPFKNLERAQKEILYLQNKGYEFKIDDFGVGFGGFAYLHTLGITSIKIDKLFVDTIGSSDGKRKILDSIIKSGCDIDCEIIAEGVDDEAQVAYLKQRGVRLIQGFFFAKPEPLENLI
ncbi:EAL domain-containing protein [Grimontia hollisae]|uniref:EAL domain-containing protein n=1 Tax=Grimontia hollisae TaxID=673 RepID=UPI0023D98B91|nr:EAL domain-containing protein [Grimontia hollisae]MDF2185917.1 EAL domain-containing protein [Grimontia hollisae]